MVITSLLYHHDRIPKQTSVVGSKTFESLLRPRFVRVSASITLVFTILSHLA